MPAASYRLRDAGLVMAVARARLQVASAGSKDLAANQLQARAIPLPASAPP